MKWRGKQFGQAAALLALVRDHLASSWKLQEKARKLWEVLVVELPPELIEGRALDLPGNGRFPARGRK